MAKKKKLFCEINSTTYAISLQKQIIKRKIKNLFSKEKYSKEFGSQKLPVLVFSHSNNMIKKGPGIDPKLQENKANNIKNACSKFNNIIIKPGESFSFWHYVGKTSKKNGFLDGRVIINGKLVSGVGGGLCNLANTINLLVMHSPLTITELHHHSDALAPDKDGIRIPYSAGTSVNYNFIDYRFKNNTNQDFQLCAWCKDDELFAELRTTKELELEYKITEEDCHFALEGENYYRNSKIYIETIDKKTGKIIQKKLNWNNHSKVLFDYDLIPKDQIR